MNRHFFNYNWLPFSSLSFSVHHLFSCILSSFFLKVILKCFVELRTVLGTYRKWKMSETSSSLFHIAYVFSYTNVQIPHPSFFHFKLFNIPLSVILDTWWWVFAAIRLNKGLDNKRSVMKLENQKLTIFWNMVAKQKQIE